MEEMKTIFGWCNTARRDGTFPEISTTPKGTVSSISVGIYQTKKERDENKPKTYIKVNFWQKFPKELEKGKRAFFYGKVTSREYQGKTYYDMNCYACGKLIETEESDYSAPPQESSNTQGSGYSAPPQESSNTQGSEQVDSPIGSDELPF